MLRDTGHLTLKLRAGSLISTSYLKEQCGNYRFMSPHPTIYIDSPDCDQVVRLPQLCPFSWAVSLATTGSLEDGVIECKSETAHSLHCLNVVPPLAEEVFKGYLRSR